MHAAGAAADLVVEGIGGRRQGLGVRHLEHRRDAAHDGGARAGFEVFLVLEPGLAEMDLAVDDAGQDVEAGAVDHLAARGGREIAERCDAPARTPISVGAMPFGVAATPPFRIRSNVSAMSTLRLSGRALYSTARNGGEPEAQAERRVSGLKEARISSSPQMPTTLPSSTRTTGRRV